jgi:hypothetical protein
MVAGGIPLPNLKSVRYCHIPEQKKIHRTQNTFILIIVDEILFCEMQNNYFNTIMKKLLSRKAEPIYL